MAGVTIKEVAKHAGVSIMTVSRVVNNSGYVSADTRYRVEKSIEKLNYKPNLTARSLINNKSKFISVIVPDISNPFFAELIKGTENIARKFGYNIILSDTDWSESLEVNHIEGAFKRMADGLVIVAPKLSENKLVSYNENLPIVVVDRKLQSNDILNVFLDNEKGAISATEHLINLNHKKIAFVCGPKGIFNAEKRKKGFLSAMHKNGLNVETSLMFNGDFKIESGKKVFEKLTKIDEKERPTAIFASNDMMALGIISSAQDANWNIPEDLSIVGFDDILLSSLMNPSLTTISNPYVKMGECAIRKLLATLEPDFIYDEDNEKNLVNNLVARKSTKNCIKE